MQQQARTGEGAAAAAERAINDESIGSGQRTRESQWTKVWKAPKMRLGQLFIEIIEERTERRVKVRLSSSKPLQRLKPYVAQFSLSLLFSTYRKMSSKENILLGKETQLSLGFFYFKLKQLKRFINKILLKSVVILFCIILSRNYGNSSYF